MTKDERIQDEIKRLQKICENLSGNERSSIMKLIENLAFMAVTLADLMEIINNEQLVVETVNASQKFTKENPALSAYNKMYANYIKGLQQLISLLPEKKKDGNNNTDEPDELLSFLQKKSKRLK